MKTLVTGEPEAVFCSVIDAKVAVGGGETFLSDFCPSESFVDASENSAVPDAEIVSGGVSAVGPEAGVPDEFISSVFAESFYGQGYLLKAGAEVGGAIDATLVRADFAAHEGDDFARGTAHLDPHVAMFLRVTFGREFFPIRSC